MRRCGRSFELSLRGIFCKQAGTKYLHWGKVVTITHRWSAHLTRLAQPQPPTLNRKRWNKIIYISVAKSLLVYQIDCIKTQNLKYSSEKWNYFLRTCHSMYQSTSVFSLRGVMRGSVYIRQSRSALIGPLLGSLRSYWPLVTLLCRSALSPRRSEDPSTHHRGNWNIDWGWET